MNKSKRIYFKGCTGTAGIAGPDNGRRPLTGAIVGIDRPCEHCDGEHSAQVRLDELRGFVCPPCDSALDEMLDEYEAEEHAR